MGFTHMKTIFKKLFLDTIPVIFGVLIALYIGDWKAQQDDRKYMDQMIGVMKEEARANYDNLDRIIPTHLHMIDTIDYYLASGIPLMELFAQNNGFKLPPVRNSTWTAVINNRIELVGFETLKVFNNIDGLTALTDAKVEVIMDFIYENIKNTSTESKELLRLHFLNLIESEVQLFLDHRDFLEIEEESEWMKAYGIDL